FPLDKALEKAHFHDVIVAYLYFVRVNGNLLLSLEKCLTMFEHRIMYIKKFTQVIRYPIVLSFSFIILLVFIKQSVLPSFLELFQSSAESSRTVFYSILIIDLASSIFFITLLLLSVAFVFWAVYKKRLSVESRILIYRIIPLLRTFIRMQT